MNPRWPRRGLYLVTPDTADTAQLVARVEPVLAQAAWLQYRNKAEQGWPEASRAPSDGTP